MLGRLSPLFGRRRLAETTLASADRLRDARLWDAAAPLYQAYLRLRPRDAAIWVQLGHCQKEAGLLGEADASYSRAARLAPQVADIWLQIGHLRKVQGRLGEAVANYRIALEKDPALAPARFELEQLANDEAKSAPAADAASERLAALEVRLSDQTGHTEARLAELTAAVEALQSRLGGCEQLARDNERQLGEIRSAVERLLAEDLQANGLNPRAHEIYDQLRRAIYPDGAPDRS